MHIVQITCEVWDFCYKFFIVFEKLVFLIMNHGNNYAVQQVLQRLRTDELDDSCDKNKEKELQDEFIPNFYAGVESCDSDTDSGEEEQSSAAVSIDFSSGSDQSAFKNTAGQVKAQNETLRKNITCAPGLEEHLRPMCFRNVLAQLFILTDL